MPNTATCHIHRVSEKMSSPIRAFASVAFLIAATLSSVVVLVPSIAADKPGIGAFVALLIGGMLMSRCKLHSTSRGFFWLMLPAAALLIPTVTIARSFRRLDMVSVLFHAQTGVADAGIEGLETEILQAVLASVFLVLSLWALGRLWGSSWRKIMTMALLLVLINPFVTAFAVLAVTPGPKADLTKVLVTPRLGNVPTPAVDLLMIYLEGTDRQFADPAVWGDAYAPLNNFASEGVAFNRVSQIVATGWSTAGITASLCGVPIVPRGLLYGMNFEKMHSYMPGVTCLGDLAQQAGYQTAFVVGGPLEFGGLDMLFGPEHGFEKAVGRDELRKIYPKSETDAALIGWTLDDQLVFKHAKTLHEEMLAKPAPYSLVIETIGPHGYEGYLSRHCAADGKAQFSRDTDRVLRCTIDDAIRFVKEARARQAAKRPGHPLLVVLQSDHLNHDALTPNVAAEYGGYNTVMMAGAGLPASLVVNKPAGMIDVYPTILQALGLQNPPYEAGLGRSLLASLPTLVETYGTADLEPMVVMNPDLGNIVWQLGDHKPAP
jgi:phosphoglycerol transferase